MIPSRINIFNVHTVKKNFTFCRVVESFYHRNNWRFSTTWCSTKSNDSVFCVVNFDINTFQYLNINFWRIMKFNIFQSNDPLNLFRVLNLHSTFRVNFWFVLKNFNNFFGSSYNLSSISKNERHNPEVKQQHDDVEQEWSHLTNSYHVFLIQQTSNPDDKSHC